MPAIYKKVSSFCFNLCKKKHLYRFLQYVYIIVDPLLLILRNAFSDPYDIPNLLLSQLDVCIKDAVIELLLKCQSIQENFMLEKLVFHGLVTSCSIKEITIFLPHPSINP